MMILQDPEHNGLKTGFSIYSKYGEGKVLNNYFLLLAQHFPKRRDGRYTRNLNFGEFIHYWSGASGVNLQEAAEKAI